ncbi:MAG: hypothetical protein IPJ84_13425 [Bdellovibrionales bacterium]|nr:hypothetical protein [Bdellovibrionales bacterium]
MKAMKRAFYPVAPVERELRNVPKGHLSERVNELILKGLSAEKQQEVALAYQQYNAALAHSDQTEDRDPITGLMAARIFESEDEAEDFV